LSVRVAVPIFRVSCTIGIDKVRSWSVVEELLLWAVTRTGKTIAELSAESSLPRQIVVAAIARLMRFRLVEVSIEAHTPAFRASEYGVQILRSGERLPHFPTRYWKNASFVICRATGCVFATRDLGPLLTDYRLKQAKRDGLDIRVIQVTAGAPEMSNEANVARLSTIAVRGLDEELATVDARTASMRADEFMVVRVSGQEMSGLPREAGAVLRRLIMHSTFLRAGAFTDLVKPLRLACRSGVTFDTFWGAEADEKATDKNRAAAIDIMNQVNADHELRGRFRISLHSTGSHAKLMLMYTADGWIAVVSTCNWLYSDFSKSVEMAVVLREPALVADVAVVLQRLIGQRGLADAVATELAGIVRELRAMPQRGGGCRAAVVCGEQHDELMRTASAGSERCFFVGTHRLGSTARTGTLMPAEVAARRHGQVTVLYTRTSGPLKNRHARMLVAEEKLEGVRLVQTDEGETNLHAKFVAWDDDDLLVTSLNWGSASTDVDSPCDEVGIHIHAPGIGAGTVARMHMIFPELDE
jgi:cardiolipin synthase